MHSEAQKWDEYLAMFMEAGDVETRLLRFDEVGGGRVNMGYWLKFNPHEHQEKVERLNWAGEVVGDILERTPRGGERFKGRLWFVTTTVREFPTRPGCSYYDQDGDPFDPANEANWDGEQQIGFRD